jgi:hypothetical protein
MDCATDSCNIAAAFGEPRAYLGPTDRINPFLPVTSGRSGPWRTSLNGHKRLYEQIAESGRSIALWTHCGTLATANARQHQLVSGVAGDRRVAWAGVALIRRALSRLVVGGVVRSTNARRLTWINYQLC